MVRIKKFQDWSTSFKVIGGSVVSIGLLASVVLFYVLPKVEETIYSEKRQATKNIVDVPYSILAEYDARAQKGELTVEEAQRRATASIQNLRYDEKEYFWINDMTPRMIMHPYKPELDGKDISDNADPNGKHLFLDMVSVCKEHGEGFVEYMWPKPGVDKPVPKISYVKLYKPWGWIVGSGIYVDDVENQIAALRWSIMGGLLIGILVSIGIGVVIGRMVAGPLKEMVVRLDNADLNTVLQSSRKDEIGDLTRSFDRFVGTIKSTLLQVSEVSSAVASASAEISSSTEQLAAGSQEQTSQASEVASAVEEMTSTIGENSKNATTTADTAREAKVAAQKGGQVVKQTIDGMKRIAEVVSQSAVTVQALSKSSDQIGEIIGVIDDIADQTNLLALNAAIEAARAGEQGRGFAVVADEVRKLAERTTKATKEITGMIKRIQHETTGAVASMEGGTTEVQKGITLAENAGHSLNEIVLKSEKVTDMVAQIAAASEEQSSASGEIAKNMEAISSVTNETAQGTQQIARAAEDLNRLTESLQQFVNRFKLSDGHSESMRGTSTQSGASSTVVRENGSLAPQATLIGEFDVEAAKRAHLVWRSRVQRLLQGKETVDENSVVSHRDCALGKWYYSMGQTEFGNGAVFVALGKKHEEMHHSVKKTATLWNSGRKAEAREVGEAVYRLSDEVVNLLDELTVLAS
ncbi:MAG: methyl-accepting chemotaxis protein [Bacteroidota bacterium]